MTTSINHPNPGEFLQKNRALAVAALAAAAVTTVALYTQATGGDATSSPSHSVSEQLVEVIDRSSDQEHFLSVNDIPWRPASPATITVDQQAQLAAELDAIRAGSEQATPVVDQQAQLATELDAIRAGNKETTPVVDQQAQLAAELDAIRAGSVVAPPRATERSSFLAMNDIPWLPYAGTPALVTSTGSDMAFFLSINDAGETPAASASRTDGDRAFFLSINDVEE